MSVTDALLNTLGVFALIGLFVLAVFGFTWLMVNYPLVSLVLGLVALFAGTFIFFLCSRA